MYLRYLVLLSIIYTGFSFAISSTEVSANINDIKSNIRQINHDLDNKQQKKRNLDRAISNSGAAIEKSEQILEQLENQQIHDQRQLQQINAMLPVVANNINQVESTVKSLMHKSYVQINQLNNSSGSILAGNDNLYNQHKKTYLLKLLTQQYNKYQSLQKQLEQLNYLNTRLKDELVKINKELGNVSGQKDWLQQNLTEKTNEAHSLNTQIKSERQKLDGLKQQQAQLNRLLTELETDEENTPKHTASNNSVINEAYEDNSPFLKRNLVKPVNGQVILKFGVVKNQTRNHGVLFAATDLPVYSISNGRVLYTGNLPGLGHLVVVNNGDNYVSIYGGIIPKVAKGDIVSRGEVIATTGNSSNQPMGGVYFELRHYGKPVNPTSLLN